MGQRFRAFRGELFRRPIIERFQTPAKRRSIALSVVLINLVTVGCVLLISGDILWPLVPVAVASVLLMGLLNMATRGIFELSDEYLDEYQVSVRDSAFRRSYYFTLIWLLLVAPLFGFLEGNQHSKLFVLAFILLGFMWGVTLPRVIVAWTQAPELDEDV